MQRITLLGVFTLTLGLWCAVVAAAPDGSTTSHAASDSIVDLRHAPQSSDDEEPTSLNDTSAFVPGEIILKFADPAGLPYTPLALPDFLARLRIAAPAVFAALASTRVTAATPVFSVSAAAQAIRARYPARAQRAAPDSRIHGAIPRRVPGSGIGMRFKNTPS